MMWWKEGNAHELMPDFEFAYMNSSGTLVETTPSFPALEILSMSGIAEILSGISTHTRSQIRDFDGNEYFATAKAHNGGIALSCLPITLDVRIEAFDRLPHIAVVHDPLGRNIAMNSMARSHRELVASSLTQNDSNMNLLQESQCDIARYPMGQNVLNILNRKHPIIDNLPDPILLVDIEQFAVISCNKAENIRCGGSLFQDPIRTLLQQEYTQLPQAMEELSHAILTGSSYETRIDLPNTLDSTSPFRVTTMPYIDDRGTRMVALILRDISDIVNMEKERDLKNTVMENVLKTNGIIITVIRANTLDLIEANQGALDSLHLVREQLDSGISMADDSSINDPNFLVNGIQETAALLHQTGPKSIEFDIIDEKGSTFHVMKAPVVIAGDIFVWTTARDVTALSERETLLQAVLDVVPEAITVKESKEYRIIEASAECCRMMERNRDEILGRCDSEIARNTTAKHADALRRRHEADERLVNDLISGGSGYEDYEFHVPVGDNHETEVFAVHNRAFYCPGQETPYIISIARNITELRGQEQLFRTVLETIPVGLTIKNGNTFRYSDSNASGCRALGVKREDIMGKTIDEALGTTHHALLKRYREEDEEAVKKFEEGDIDYIERFDAYFGHRYRKRAFIVPGQGIFILTATSLESVPEESGPYSLTPIQILLDALPDCMSIKDASTLRYVDVNQAFCRLVGIDSRYEAIGRISTELQQSQFPKDRTSVDRSYESDRQLLFDFMRGGASVVNYSEHGHDVRKVVYKASQDEIHIMTIVRNISTEKAYKDAGYLLQSVFDALSEPIIVENCTTHKIFIANQAACRRINKNPLDIIGMPIMDLLVGLGFPKYLILNQFDQHLIAMKTKGYPQIVSAVIGWEDTLYNFERSVVCNNSDQYFAINVLRPVRVLSNNPEMTVNILQTVRSEFPNSKIRTDLLPHAISPVATPIILDLLRTVVSACPNGVLCLDMSELFDWNDIGVVVEMSCDSLNMAEILEKTPKISELAGKLAGKVDLPSMQKGIMRISVRIGCSFLS